MKKLFTNDKFFLAMTLCAVVASALNVLLGLFVWGLGLADCCSVLICFGCVVVLYSSYKKHSKNVMKGMMGALLMNLLLGSITNFSIFGQEETAFLVSSLILNVVLFVNHFIINSDHHSSPCMVKMNQIIAGLNVLFYIIWNAFSICFEPSALNVIASVLNALGMCGLVISIVCVESRLDAYRLDREAAGWTEEKGYPENYVHQKDR